MRRHMFTRGLGDGFVATSNYWQQLASQKVQYVMVPGLPSMKLVPKTSLRGMRGLGDCVASPPDTFVGPDGCITDSDGNRLCCPGGIPPAPGSVNTLNLPQTTTWNSSGTQNAAIPFGPPPPPQPQTPGAWQQFTDWLGSPLSPGSSIKIGHLVGGAALLAGFAGMGRKGRR